MDRSVMVGTITRRSRLSVAAIDGPHAPHAADETLLFGGQEEDQAFETRSDSPLSLTSGDLDLKLRAFDKPPAR
jgi:hypothetical protein